jgi:hypothetical protein
VIWVEREPLGPGIGGDVGGDYQTGEAFCRSWKAPLPDGMWAVITDYWYSVQYPGRSVGIERQTEFLICTDPDMPGHTEVWGDARFQDVAGESSEERARGMCARVDVADELFAWDGRPG